LAAPHHEHQSADFGAHRSANCSAGRGYRSKRTHNTHAFGPGCPAHDNCAEPPYTTHAFWTGCSESPLKSVQMRAALARAAQLRGIGVAAAATVTTASCAERRACPGFEVPLDRRYKGTAAAREARGRGCLTDAEVVQCAEIINNFVDLPFFTEEQEQEIFEFSVCRLVERLAQVLPNEVINMIHSDQSLPRLPAAELEKRLHAWLVDTWQMPLLDELDRRHVVHCLLVLVRA
jgi:hypothetical protein